MSIGFCWRREKSPQSQQKWDQFHSPIQFESSQDRLNALLTEQGSVILAIDGLQRQQLAYREEARRKQWRFRKDPASYLANIERRLLQ